jgi:two-component system, cell cycle sensor histidine kinase and response regulator CckA
MTPPEPTELALLASIVRSSHDAIVCTDLDGTVLSWNPGAEDLYGYASRDMVGRSIEVMIPPDRREDERQVAALVAAGGRLSRYRSQRLRKNGAPITVVLTVSPLIDDRGHITGVATIGRGLSDREQTEATVQAVMEAAPDAILGVDERGRIVLANAQAGRVFDRGRHTLVGEDIHALVPVGLAGPEPTAGAGQAPGGTVTAEPGPVTALRRDGTGFPAEITTSALDTDGTRITVVAVRDITERLRQTAERNRYKAEAEAERAQLREHRAQRLESLGQLAGGVAHDFNNLLAIITSYAGLIGEEAIADRPDLASIAADIAQVARAAARGADLTRQLLAFARRDLVRPRVLDLNQVVTGVEQMLRRTLGEHIALRARLAGSLPNIRADPGQLEQVLVNLAVNARDAMPEGGALTIDTDAVLVDDRYAAARPDLEPGRYVRIRVGDTGRGMPREVADRAFEPFYTTKPAGEGTGLGLASVYGIVTQAGGGAHIYSEPGVGTTVAILLPAVDREADPTAAPRPSAAPGHGETILVVEDEPALRDVTCRALRGHGYRILAPDTPAAALDLAATHAGPIDLLLTDVIMPGLLGTHLAEQVTAIRPTTPVLYMSGYALPALTDRGMLDPEVVLLEKPFTTAALLAAIRERLPRRP